MASHFDIREPEPHKQASNPLKPPTYLRSDEDCAQYLQARINEAPDAAALFAKALGDIARARGMMQLAKRAPALAANGSTKPWVSKASPALQRTSKSCTRLAFSSIWGRGRYRAECLLRRLGRWLLITNNTKQRYVFSSCLHPYLLG